MVTSKLKPVEDAQEQVKKKQNFLFVGGAGSGKTESLNRLIGSLISDNRYSKIACITHTNKAVEQIIERVSEDIDANTIHSFLHSLISPFKSNIKMVFPLLFKLPKFEKLTIDHYGNDEKIWKKEEHGRYTKSYKKADARFRIILGKKLDREAFKKLYDKNPDEFNTQLNGYIDQINQAVDQEVRDTGQEKFEYNETRFDSYKDKTFGHDGLIKIATELLNQFPVLGKIISSKYDCLFIDEYQDTDSDLLEALLNRFDDQSITIGLFGDPEQAIYQDRVSVVQQHVDNNKLAEIIKEDNFRSSQPVIDVANKLRTDGLTQELRLKDGEDIADRAGSAVFLYSIMPAIPEDADNTERRKIYDFSRDALVAHITEKHGDFTHLKATNKSIATDAGFGMLYEIFSDRYPEPRERIESTLGRMQFSELDEIIRLYKTSSDDVRSFNALISLLNKRGFLVRKVADKEKLKEKIRTLISSNLGAYNILKSAVDAKLIAMSESNKALIARNNETIERLSKDDLFQEFRKVKFSGANTKLRMLAWLKDHQPNFLTREIIDDRFEELDRELLNLVFIERLFSNDLKLNEIISYFEYERDEKSFSTMHKTKGTGIPKVLVILHEYGFKRDYDFLSCFSGEPPDGKKQLNARRLLYVACSRAINDLICVRLVQNKEEADRIGAFFQAKREIKF